MNIFLLAININLEPNIEGYYKFIQSIHNATEKDTGTYICIAANRGGSTVYIITVIIEKKQNLLQIATIFASCFVVK